MSNKTLVVLGVGVLALIALYVAASQRGVFGEAVPENEVPEAAVAEFTQTMQNKVIQEDGHPIEGFEPSMFMNVYPGLEERDFDGVEAAIGVYVYENGTLVHDLQGEREVHSAAQAISEEGMATLLANVSGRLGVNVSDEEGVGEVMALLEASGETAPDPGEMGETEGGVVESPPQDDVAPAPEENVVPGEKITLEGEVVCLPHKDTSGPQTMECAFGLRTENGTHFGLGNLFSAAPMGSINTGSRVRVTGTLDDPEPGNRYAIEAIVDIQTITEI